MRSYRIYLYRHGKTAANDEGRFIGSTDEVLSESGIVDLITLTENGEYPAVGKVYASPLQRCLQTARVLYPMMTPYAVDGLREYHFGELENKSLQALSQNAEFEAWVAGRGGIAGAEEMEAFNTRIKQAFSDIVQDMMANRISDVAVVTHGGVIMSLLGMCGLPRCTADHWTVDNGHGYSLLINAQLWGNTMSFEICDRLPYQEQEEFEIKNFDLLDVDELKNMQ